jgi:hypothetical protein
MAAGATAGAIAAVVCNPLDLLKCQLQASGGGGVRGYEYRSALGAIRYIIRSSPKGARGLWVGTTVSIPRSMMSTSVMMTTQSWMKETALERQVSPWVATAGSSLGAAAATIYAQAPLDIVRARLFSPKGAADLGNANQKGAVAIAATMMSVSLLQLAEY